MKRPIFTPIKEPRNGQIRVLNRSQVVALSPTGGPTIEQTHTFEQYWDGEWLPINVVEEIKGS